jgi:hypothetical protein
MTWTPAIFDAYGWPRDLTDEQILERFVALNRDRSEEKKNGLVRWLRPEFQNPAGTGKPVTQRTFPGTEEEEGEAVAATGAAAPWPKKLPAQIAAVRDLFRGTSRGFGLDDVLHAFRRSGRSWPGWRPGSKGSSGRAPPWTPSRSRRDGWGRSWRISRRSGTS